MGSKSTLKRTQGALPRNLFSSYSLRNKVTMKVTPPGDFMKKFLVLFLIYSLNIILFLFAKSAGADVVFDKITPHGYQVNSQMIDRGPAIE